MKRSILLGVALLASTPFAHADQQGWIACKQPVIAFTHATIVDGTGAAPKHDQMLVIDNGRISELGPATSTAVPAAATVIDARSKTSLPGLVRMHEHLFYTTRVAGTFPGAYYVTPMPSSFPPLYLAGGETTVRTTGSVMPYVDLNVRDDIRAGKRADIVVIDGDPMQNVSAIEYMPLVFKNGVGYDTAAIFKSMQGQIGMN
ncbi:MAG: hypothetical protein ACREPU_01345 [Rhodanobacteraceae bacterium]